MIYGVSWGNFHSLLIEPAHKFPEISYLSFTSRSNKLNVAKFISFAGSLVLTYEYQSKFSFYWRVLYFRLSTANEPESEFSK